jgi:hypothetical protein
MHRRENEMAAQLQELTLTGPVEPCDDWQWEPIYVLRNPDWYREGDNPQVQIVSIAVSYNGGIPQAVTTRLFPGEVLQQIEKKLSRDLLYDALYEAEEARR